MKKNLLNIAAVATFVIVAIFLGVYALAPQLITPWFQGYGGLQIGDALTLALPPGGWAVWQLSKRSFSAKDGVKPCLLVLDVLGRGTVEKAAKEWAAGKEETKDLDVVTFVAEKGNDGQVDLQKVYPMLESWIGKKVIGRYGYCFVVLAGPVGSGVVVGLQLANLTDGMIVEFQQGQYVPTATFSKKSIAPPHSLTAIKEEESK